MLKLSPFVLSPIASLFLAGAAAATSIDLTPGPGSTGTIGGVTYAHDQLQPSGTGVLNPFVRIQANGSEEGYNTSNSDFPFDEQPPAGGFTRDLTFGELQDNGAGGFEFVLDVAEPQGGPTSSIILDALQIYVTDTPSQNTTNLASLGTLLYDMDAIEDSDVTIGFETSGNGISDMLMTVPTSVFAGVLPGQYIILYSHFSDSGGSFEEWAHVTQAVPAPGTALLLVTGLLGLAVAPGRIRK